MIIISKFGLYKCGEHDNNEAASDVHVIDADGVFHNDTV